MTNRRLVKRQSSAVLRQVLGSDNRATFLNPPDDFPSVELVSRAEMSLSDERPIQSLLKRASAELDMALRVVGGGRGCTRVVISVEFPDPIEAHRLLGELFHSEAFCAAAAAIGFDYLYRREPYIHKTLHDGSYRGALPEVSIPAFISYAREDASHRERLERHISPLIRQKQLAVWDDRKIAPGASWETEIQSALREAKLFILLISADFFASDYCCAMELPYAIERSESGAARTVPVLVRPVDWGGTPVQYLQFLPLDGRPITTWPEPDEAWMNVAKGLRALVRQLRQEQTDTRPRSDEA